MGEEPNYYNKEDKNIEVGSYTSYKNQPTYQKAVSLFNGFHTQINQQQLDFVNFELGKLNSISRIKASWLLYKALFQYIIIHPATMKSIGYHFYQKIKRIIWNNGLKKVINPVVKYFSLKQDKLLYSCKEKLYYTF